MIGSTCGGTSIEDIAKEKPEAIFTKKIDIHEGLTEALAVEMAQKMQFPEACVGPAAKNFMNLYKLMAKTDATLVEINPVIETLDGKVLCADAKINFHDNASYRQKEVFAMRDMSQEDPLEVQSSKFDLNFVKLDGNIGCMVNGAGLAMSTMDIIKLHGGEPANFLDVGGGVTAEGAAEAFRILLSDPKVKGVLVNIFGGIAKCDLIAQALVSAGREIGFSVPVVVRLEGTNVERAREILSAAREEMPTLTSATDLADAARKVVAAVG